MFSSNKNKYLAQIKKIFSSNKDKYLAQIKINVQLK